MPLKQVSASQAPLRISPRPRISSVREAVPWAFGSAFDLKHRLWVTSGRAAIALALRHAGVSRGAEVLVPAYASSSMIDPLNYLGLTPVYYALDEALRVDRREIMRRLNSATRAVLVTQFHGLAYDISDIYKYCQGKGLILIEDRAHAFFGPGGEHADYVAYSATKFFPVYEGGILGSRDRQLDMIPTSSPPLEFQIKAALWPYEYASLYDPLQPRNTLATSLVHLKRRLKKLLGSALDRRDRPRGLGPAAADGGPGIEHYWLNKSISIPSRRSVLRAELSWIAATRRANWTFLVTKLSEMRGIRLIHEQLSEDSVPYAVAFTVSNPEPLASALKSRGVPLFRWNTSTLSTQDPSLFSTLALSRTLFQIPTHQSISFSELERMAEVISKAIHEYS